MPIIDLPKYRIEDQVVFQTSDSSFKLGIVTSAESNGAWKYKISCEKQEYQIYEEKIIAPLLPFKERMTNEEVKLAEAEVVLEK